MSSDDEMRLLHPGWDPRRRLRDRRRRPWFPLLLVSAVLLLAGAAFGVSLLRITPDPPPNRPAFPPEAFTTPPPPPAPPGAVQPEFDEGGPQVHPATMPTAPARVARDGDDTRACGIDDLSLVSHGWERATGNGWTTVTATNMRDESCVLGAWPQARIVQTRPLSLTFQQVSKDFGGQPAAPKRLLLQPGRGASVVLWWRGYGGAADQKTPQRLLMRFGSGDWREIPWSQDQVGAAPFDLVDGGQVEVYPWMPAAQRG